MGARGAPNRAALRMVHTEILRGFSRLAIDRGTLAMDRPGTNVFLNEGEKKCFDPLLLPDVVVSTILEFVYGDTLLTGRLVCRRWRREITRRKGLWRRRCEWLGAVSRDKAFPPKTDFFRVYLNLGDVLRRMFFRAGWRLEEHCDGSQCVFHREMARHEELDRHIEWISRVVPHIKQTKRFGTKIAVCTAYGELVVLEEETKQVAWRTEKYATDIMGKYKDRIFTVTQFGKIELYSLDGKCAVTDTGGKLRNVMSLLPFPAASFLLILLPNDQVFHFNDEMGVTPLRLPQQAEGEGSGRPTDADPIKGIRKDKLACLMSNGPRDSMDQVVQIVRHTEARLIRSHGTDDRPDFMYIVSNSWLDGLSPSTMAPDRPVAVIFSAQHPRGKCLRWSQGLWGNIYLSSL
ncbi:hypothetical protein ACOMHN_058637 [Nucella lapillus]